MSFRIWLKSLFKKKKTDDASLSFDPVDINADQEYCASYDMDNIPNTAAEIPEPGKSDSVPVIPEITEEDGEPPVPVVSGDNPVILGTGHRFFTVDELCTSKTASVKHIDNTPSDVIRRHLDQLIETLLDPIREAWGSAINVTSGYRCPELNSAVGGVRTSAHKYGWAADLQPCNGKQSEFERFIRNWAMTSGVRYDQIIIEKSKSARWIHIGLYNASGQQRMQLFNLSV